jgi:chromosome partitioning protein
MSATVIAIAQRKGGSGKTTLAAHLSVTWAMAKRDVAVIDTDPQGSLAQWYQKRAERLGRDATGIDFTAVTGWRGAGTIFHRSREHEIVLIDSPANADADVRATIREAGLVLIPVQPTPVDVWATLPTLTLAQEERVPALLVLNRVPARASLTAVMRLRLARYDVGLASIGIGNRIALAAAFAEGFGIAESDPASAAALEITALAAEVLGLLPEPMRLSA